MSGKYRSGPLRLSNTWSVYNTGACHGCIFLSTVSKIVPSVAIRIEEGVVPQRCIVTSGRLGKRSRCLPTFSLVLANNENVGSFGARWPSKKVCMKGSMRFGMSGVTIARSIFCHMKPVAKFGAPPPTPRHYFLEQLRADTIFLRSHNLIDYSLLVGIQKLGTPKGPKDADEASGSARRPTKTVARAALTLPSRNLSVGLRSKEGTEVFYFGVIDLLTPFDTKRLAESTFKTIVQNNASCVPPAQYQVRSPAPPPPPTGALLEGGGGQGQRPSFNSTRRHVRNPNTPPPHPLF